MLYSRFETQALLNRASYLRSSLFTWDWEGISLSKLSDLARDIDTNIGRLTAASATYTSIDHPESAALVAELDELAAVRGLLFIAPE